MKIPFVIYSNVRIASKNLFTLQKNKHIACGYSLFTHCSFNSKKTGAKYDFYRSKTL